MGIFNIFGKKKDRRTSNLAPSTAESELGGLMTAQKWQLKKERMQLEHDIEMLKLERQKMQLEYDLQDLQGDDDDGGIDGMLQNLIMNAMQKGQLQPKTPTTLPQEQAQQTNITLTQEQIANIWLQIPSVQKPLIKMASDSQIMAWLQNNYPQLNDESRIKAIQFVRSQ